MAKHNASFPYRGGKRWTSWEGTAGKASKDENQGGTYLIPAAEWGTLADIQGNDPLVLGSALMERAFQAVVATHSPGRRIALFSLCTATRPYSLSRKWKRYVAEFEPYADLIIHSNGGLIPIEYEGQYPYLTYDAHGEAQYDKQYIEVGIRRMKQFLQTHRYDFVLFNFRHKMRNFKVAQVVGPWAKAQGLIRDFAILPTKAQYEQSQREGFADAGYKIYPELWPTMFDPVLQQLKEWHELHLVQDVRA